MVGKLTNWMAIGLVLGCLGCKEPQAKPLNPLPNASAEGPEASFQRIDQDIRRALLKDSTSSSAKIISATVVGEPTVESTISVQAEYLPSEQPSEPHRARITVKTVSSVTTVKDSAKEDPEEGKSPKKDDQQREELREKLGDAASQNMLEALSNRNRANPQSGATVTLDNEQIREYDLTFRQGEWVLENPPDKDREPLHDFAFEYAMGRQ